MAVSLATGSPRQGPAARRIPGLAVALLLGALAVFVAHALVYWAYVNDDAFITFRYGRQLASGRGPYFNPGEHVEGYTSLSWMLLMSVAYALGGEPAPPAISRVLGVALSAAAVAVSFWLHRWLALARGEPEARAALGGLAVAGVSALSVAVAVNSTSGLETSLFSLLLTLGAAAAAREVRRPAVGGSSLLFAGAYLTRPEGAVAFAVSWLALTGLGLAAAVRARPVRWTTALRKPLVDGAIFTAIVAAHLLWRRATYDGEWLPNTYYAKLGGFAGVTPAGYVGAFLERTVLGWPGLALGVAGAAWIVRRQRELAPVAAVALAGTFLPFVTGSDWMVGARLIAPYVPLLAAVCVAGWTELAGLLPRLKHRAPAIALALLPLVGWLQWEWLGEVRAEVELRGRGYQTGHRALASWLNARARPGDRVALMDVGIVGYYGIGLEVIDISGLTDKLIARSPGQFLHKEYDVGHVLARDPRWVVVVLYAPGTSYVAPPEGTGFAAWTGMEARLLAHPTFRRRYPGEPRTFERTGAWTDELGERVGARRIFEHAHPGLHYLLAVFERRAE